MNYTQFLFSQLFAIIMKEEVEDMTYEDVFPVLDKVCAHWIATDELYGRLDHESEYDAMEKYLKSNKSMIACLLSE